MKTLNKIKKIAACREKHYRLGGGMTMQKMQAITKIKRLADFYGDRPEEVHQKVLMQIREDVMVILPSEQSRYSHLREEAIRLIGGEA